MILYLSLTEFTHWRWSKLSTSYYMEVVWPCSIQRGAVITRSIFSKIGIIDTHSSRAWVRHDMCFVRKFLMCVTEVLYEILCYIGPCYGGTDCIIWVPTIPLVDKPIHQYLSFIVWSRVVRPLHGYTERTHEKFQTETDWVDCVPNLCKITGISPICMKLFVGKSVLVQTTTWQGQLQSRYPN